MDRIETQNLAADSGLIARFLEALVREGVSRSNAELYLKVRGLGGARPVTLRQADPAKSGERVRQIVVEVEALHVPAVLQTTEAAAIRGDLAPLVRAVVAEAPGTTEDIAKRLLEEGLNLPSPSSIVRLADVFGIDHRLAVREWRGLDKSKWLADRGTDVIPFCKVEAIVPAEMPSIVDGFLSMARRVSRGVGVVSARALAEMHSTDRGLPLSEKDAYAMLSPFAVRICEFEGDRWFSFFNSPNEFLLNTSSRVSVLGSVSLEQLALHHARFNRSRYAEFQKAPAHVLGECLRVAGYTVEGGLVKASSLSQRTGNRTLSEIQLRMVEVFRRMLLDGKGHDGTVRRADLFNALSAAGVNSSTALMYTKRQGLFSCSGGRCRLTDGDVASVPASQGNEREPTGTGETEDGKAEIG